MAEERKKVSPEQLSILIEELEKDTSLQTGKGSARNTKILYVEKWEALARKLNSVESGALKNVTKWQQAWRDWKSNTRKKAVKTALDGSSDLTSLELRVLNMCEGDNTDVKPGGIDISNIAEMDPLSSEENSCDGMDNSATPELLTVYSNDIKVEDEDDTGKRPCSEDEAVNITRKRIKVFPQDKNNEKLTDIVSRLITVEASRIESENQRTKLLQDIAMSMGRQVEAAERQADALTRIVELLERDRDG